ncbi:MAG: DUF3786 domain-containing protein [Spirochaetota bacterium]|nr:DUF3786 domain-containing protein [Spirochaetota bacterium]
MDKNKNIKENEKIYLNLLQQLSREDLDKKAAVKDLPVQSDGKILIESFARSYLVCHEGVTAFDAGPVSFQQKFAVVSYLLSDEAGEPAFDFVPFGHLGGYNIGRDQHVTKSLKQPILKKFSDNYELFTKAALKIGGIQKENDNSGKHIWLFYAFPKLPIRLTFYERDEEFSADVQVLFDNKALDFLGLTCLGFLPDYFKNTLLDASSEF